MSNADQKRLPIYPKNFLQFTALLNSEKRCEEFLYNIRWEKGFICPLCGHEMDREKLPKSQKPFVSCIKCGRKISITSGTIMHNTHLSLRKWISAMWLMSTMNTGISANDLQALLGLKRYATVFYLQKKIRSAMIRLNREKLRNGVEVDIVSASDTINITNSSSKLTTDGILVAVEFKGKSWRRIRFLHSGHLSSKNVLEFIKDVVDKDARIQTNDREIFSIIGDSGYTHEISVSEYKGVNKFTPKPRVRVEIDRVRRWLSTTHHGRVSLKYLQSYLDEYAFRHNRRLHEDVGHTFLRLVQQSVNIHHQLKMADFD